MSRDTPYIHHVALLQIKHNNLVSFLKYCIRLLVVSRNRVFHYVNLIFDFIGTVLDPQLLNNYMFDLTQLI